MRIPFNKPFLTGKEPLYIIQAVYSGSIAGNGPFTKKCQQFFEERYGFRKTLLTSSCTDALEMAALLSNIEPGDEVILPSYTFVSTANAFVLRGARIVFADSEAQTPNIDAERIEPLITEKTKAIVVVHYGGVACQMERIMETAEKHNIRVIEDAAHAVDSFYNDRPLGSIGHLATMSFHETKNVISGEGGMLIVNNEADETRSEVLWEKGTNRAAFSRGEVEKYDWIDIGSSFLPSELISAFLYAQLENLDDIQKRRVALWQGYNERLKPLAEKGYATLPYVPHYASINGHLFYLVCQNLEQRDKLLTHLKSKGILAIFHYLPLHKSPFYRKKHDGRELPNACRYGECLVRLPLFFELSNENQDIVIDEVLSFFECV